MPQIRKPRKGSLQFWPRKRAKRHYARVKYWAPFNEPKPLGFAGYKVGMTHALFTDTRKTSVTKGMEVSFPTTVIECPPLKVSSVRFYKKTNSGSTLISEVFADKLDKELSRKIPIPKKIKKKIEDTKDFDDIMLLVYTQPKLTGIGKKKPELFEIAIGGKKEDKLKYAKEKLGKEITVNDVLKQGQQIDVHAITKGKGYQGPVKRFRIGLKPHKSEKSRRQPGSLGGWSEQGHVMWRVAHAGQMGYQQRTEYNKLILKIGNKPTEINPKGGFLSYGLVKNDYILVKGGVIGPKKRVIRLNYAIRPNKKIAGEIALSKVII
jgi:large subunit ribosomal protein L3